MIPDAFKYGYSCLLAFALLLAAALVRAQEAGDGGGVA
jgi:hypothetical protein